MSRGRGERGAVLVIFAAFTIVAVLMLAFVIDIGGLRQEKKEVTLSTDAAALAAAAQLDLRTFGPGTYGCDMVPVRRDDDDAPIVYAQEIVTDYLDDNGETIDEICRVQVTGPRRGYVVVGGLEDVEYAFSGVVGQQRGRVHGVSASVARVDFGGGLRPLGLCAGETTINVGTDGQPYNLHDDVVSADRDDDGNLDVDIDAVVALEHLDRDAECSVVAPGRRGQLDLDTDQHGNGGNNRCTDPDPEPEDADEGYFSSEYRYGYYGQVNEWTLSDGGADYKTLDQCFQRDIVEEQLIWLPIFDEYDDPPESTLHLVGFAQAQLTGYCISNAVYFRVPASIGCLADVPGETGPGSPWLRMTISRFVEFDEAGPPLTDDALRDSPAICAEKDEPALLSACVPPNPPPLGSPGDPTPPPVGCQLDVLTAVSPSEITVTLEGRGGNKVPATPAVAYDVYVVDPLRCTASDIDVEAVPLSGAGSSPSLDVSPNGLISFKAVLDPGTTLQPGSYAIVATVGTQSDSSARLHAVAP